MRTNKRIITILAILLVCFGGTISAQNKRERITRNGGCQTTSALNGVYRINVESSNRLYTVIENAATNVPDSERQQFFMDLAVRLTPPDLLAIECRANRVSLASSRAARTDFVADGMMRNIRNGGGQTVRSRIGFDRGSLVFTSSGGSGDNLNFTFTPLEDGKRLRVTRRIASRELTEPVVIQTVYEKINDVVGWDIYGKGRTDAQIARQNNEKTAQPAAPRQQRVIENNKAESVRRALDEWIDATNARDIEKQMSFYMPQLKAFYLARNASRNSVQLEKSRAFAAANSIDISAAEPEIIFQDNGQTAIMRFRKKYSIENGSKSRSGEVVQELRWQRTPAGWRIFSERDIRVIS